MATHLDALNIRQMHMGLEGNIQELRRTIEEKLGLTKEKPEERPEEKPEKVETEPPKEEVPPEEKTGSSMNQGIPSPIPMTIDNYEEGRGTRTTARDMHIECEYSRVAFIFQ